MRETFSKKNILPINSSIIEFGGLNKSDLVVLDFWEQFSPNAIFEILHSNIHIDPDFFMFNLTLGRDFECISQCYIDLTNTKEFHKSGVDSILVTSQDGTNYRPQHRFKIFSRNVYHLSLQNLFLALGLSVLFFSIERYISLDEDKKLKSYLSGKFREIRKFQKNRKNRNS